MGPKRRVCGSSNLKWPTSGRIGYTTPAVWGGLHRFRTGDKISSGPRMGTVLLSFLLSGIFCMFLLSRISFFFTKELIGKKIICFFTKYITQWKNCLTFLLRNLLFLFTKFYHRPLYMTRYTAIWLQTFWPERLGEHTKARLTMSISVAVSGEGGHGLGYVTLPSSSANSDPKLMRLSASSTEWSGISAGGKSENLEVE